MTYSEAMEKIRKAGEKFKSGTLEAGIAEVLTEMAERNTEHAKIIADDLENPEMGIKAAGKQLYEYARKHKNGNSYYMAPAEAKKLIAEFYGISEEKPEAEKPAADAPVDLMDLL